MSGHSKWANIKHRKGAQDKRRAKIFHKLARELSVAARMGGSGDPQTNFRLRTPMDAARAAEMPKDSIEAAIKRGLGQGEGERYEEAAYEGYGPAGSAILVEALTDNRTRTVAELRTAFEKGGGSLGAPGCVAWMFDKKGYLVILKRIAPEDKIVETLIEGGAENYEDRGDHFEVFTAPEDFEGLKQSLEKAKISVEYSRLSFVPKTTVEPDAKQAGKLRALVETLEEHDDVQNVWTNADFADDEKDAA
jgi:YebC/PmpR family DNA-binding regulatory protein